MSETDEEKKVREEKEAEEKKAADEAEAKEKADAEAAPASSDKKETKSPLEEARALDKSIKDGSIKMQKLLEKNEKIFADAAIAGQGFAGQSPPVKKTEDEIWAEDAKKRYEGTGMDPTPDDSGPTKYSR